MTNPCPDYHQGTLIVTEQVTVITQNDWIMEIKAQNGSWEDTIRACLLHTTLGSFTCSEYNMNLTWSKFHSLMSVNIYRWGLGL